MLSKGKQQNNQCIKNRCPFFKVKSRGNYLALVEFNKEIFGYKLLILDPTYKIAKNRFPGVDRFNKGSDIENVSKTILEDLKK